MTASVRAAELRDRDAVYALLRELGYAVPVGEFERAYREVLGHPEMRVLVAEAHGAVLGVLTLSHRVQLRLAGRIATIDELVVTAGARGAGVGRALLEEAKREARALGAQRVQLQTNRARESYLRGFYRKNGFVEVPSATLRLPAEASLSQPKAGQDPHL